MEQKNQTDATVIKDLALKQVQDIQIKKESLDNCRNQKSYIFVPEGVNVVFPKELNVNPPKACHTFIDVDSFVKYMACYCNSDESRLFACVDTLTLIGCIDYIIKGKQPSLAVEANESHNAIYKIFKTDAFKAWVRINDTTIDQASFSAFLLEYANCVVEPDAARMLEIATTLEIKSDVQFNSQERTSDGGYNLNYVENINAQAGGKGNKIKVPEMIKLKFKAFEGGTEMELNARLFYKLQNGNVVFKVKILNLNETILNTFKATCNKIAEDLSLDIHYISNDC